MTAQKFVSNDVLKKVFATIFIYCQESPLEFNSQLITYLALEAKIDGQA
jgi:hypothetical protein